MLVQDQVCVSVGTCPPLSFSEMQTQTLRSIISGSMTSFNPTSYKIFSDLGVYPLVANK